MTSRKRRRSPWLLLTGVAAALGLSLLLYWALNSFAIPPRQVGPYVTRRASGHNPAIENVGRWLGNTLVWMDRGSPQDFALAGLRVGAQTTGGGDIRQGNVILVQSSTEAKNAIEHARPGDVITFLPGNYHFGGARYINASQAGTENQRIVVRSALPGTAHLVFSLEEGFLVSAPYWTFENLSIRGSCSQDSDCEHAFHVTGKATHFIARNNTITDFNAHFKINGDEQFFPDEGLLEGNTLTNTTARHTRKPVTPVDLVAASHWVIRGNLITDFAKAEGDFVSYGAYAKGAGTHNHFERNLIVCEHRLRLGFGQRVGLSLGGGSTDKEYCRDHQCIMEQQYGVIESNLIMSCSDDGIYLNRAAASRIDNNTLIDTGPIVVRYPESSAELKGNLADGAMLGRDGGVIWPSDNRATNTALLYLGIHPVRSLFSNPSALDFSWADSPPRHNNTVQAPIPDLCGLSRPPQATYGAFEDFARCRLPDKAASGM